MCFSAFIFSSLYSKWIFNIQGAEKHWIASMTVINYNFSVWKVDLSCAYCDVMPTRYHIFFSFSYWMKISSICDLGARVAKPPDLTRSLLIFKLFSWEKFSWIQQLILRTFFWFLLILNVLADSILATFWTNKKAYKKKRAFIVSGGNIWGHLLDGENVSNS